MPHELLTAKVPLRDYAKRARERAALDMLALAIDHEMPVRTRIGRTRVELVEDGIEIYWGDSDPPSLEFFRLMRSLK